VDVYLALAQDEEEDEDVRIQALNLIAVRPRKILDSRASLKLTNSHARTRTRTRAHTRTHTTHGTSHTCVGQMYPYLWQATLPQVEAVFRHSVLQSDKADLCAVALSTLSFIAPVLPGSCPPACQEEREQGLRSVLGLLGFFLPSPPGTPSNTPSLFALRVCS
jgi:hypothetical protein